MSSAPYCNVSIATPTANPQQAPGLTPIPPNSTLQKAIQVINNNFANLVKGNFQEDRALRQTVIVRVFDPSGSGAFVDVQQIVSATWVNGITGQLITWKQ